MNRIAGLVGALGVAAGVMVAAAPGVAAAASDDHQVPVGTGPSGVVYGETVARAASVADVPDIEWPPAGVTPPKHSAEALREFAAAMGKHLDSAFPAVVPQATNLFWRPWGGEWEGIIEDGQDYLTTWAVFEDKIGSTGVNLQVEAPGHFAASPRQFCEWNEAKCEAEFLEDGSLLLNSLVEYERNERLYHIGSALHYRTDGTVVWFSAYDYDPIWDGDEGPDRDEIALSFEQLSALATDPELHL